MARDSCRRRLRPTEDIAKEILYIYETYGLHDFWFMDADFLGPKTEQERIHRLSQQISDTGIPDLTLEIDARVDGVTQTSIAHLVKAGLQKCFLGVESFDAATLNRFSKGTTPAMNLRAINILEQEGVRPIIGVIMFHPQSTKNQLRRDHEALRHIGYEKTQMLFRLKKYRGSSEAQSTDSDGRGIAPWADYGWEFTDPEIAEIWNKFDSLRLAALDKVFIDLTDELQLKIISVETFIRKADEIFHAFGEDVESIFC
jgi:Fe-S oxidoreductase